MRRTRRLLVLLAVPAATGCSRPPVLVKGPIALEARPAVHALVDSARATDADWEICFEFDRPRDSHQAARIEAMLVGAAGEHFTLAPVTLDRRGEAVVCQVGRLRPVIASHDGGTDGAVLSGIELSAGVPLTLRAIRGGART